MSIATLTALLAAVSLMQASAVQSPAPAARGYTDLPFIAAHPILVTRTGKTLTFQNGETLTDEGDCDQGDCTEYRVDGVWHGRFVGVEVAHYETGGYLVVNLGVHNSLVRTLARPIASPNGLRFFAGEHSDNQWDASQGAAVWAFDDSGPSRLRLVDTHLLMFDRFVAWRGDACVEFTGARDFNRGLKPIRTYWLAEEAGDWRLLEEPSAACRISPTSPAAAPASGQNSSGTR